MEEEGCPTGFRYVSELPVAGNGRITGKVKGLRVG